jgi:hypothetical protein
MTKKKAAPAKAEKPAKAAKAEKPAKAAKSAKAAKAAAEEEIPAAPKTGEEGDDDLDEDEAAAASSGGGGGNAAALAAAGSGEMSASFKNFRHHPDMENFYRFIYENDLRHEALAIMNQMVQQKHTEKAAAKKPAPATKR